MTEISPAVGWEQAREHFEGGGFAGAIGSKKSDNFAWSNAKGDVFDGFDVACGARDKAFECCTQSWFSLGYFISFLEILNGDVGGVWTWTKGNVRLGRCQLWEMGEWWR